MCNLNFSVHKATFVFIVANMHKIFILSLPGEWKLFTIQASLTTKCKHFWKSFEGFYSLWGRAWGQFSHDSMSQGRWVSKYTSVIQVKMLKQYQTGHKITTREWTPNIFMTGFQKVFQIVLIRKKKKIRKKGQKIVESFKLPREIANDP